MFDDLHAHFYENVIRSYNDYLSVKNNEIKGNSHDIRHGLIAASALFHFREHFPENISKSRVELGNSCPEYAILGDIANAAKHKKLNRNAPRISLASQITELVKIAEYQDGEGAYRNAEKVVKITLDNGERIELHSLLTPVLNMWIDELTYLGIISNLPHFPPLSKEIPTRDQVNELNLEMLQGVRFNSCFQYLKFNYEKNIAEPVDLTGCSAQFRIYQPKYILEWKFTHPETEHEIKFDMEITHEEKETADSLVSDKERQEYLLELAVEKGHLKRQAREYD